MIRMFAAFDNFVRLISTFGGIIGGAMVVIMSFLITANSLSRYIFNNPFLFVDEYSMYMLVAVVYLGLGYTLRAGKHVSVDMIVQHFSGRTQALLSILTSLGALVLIYLMWKYSWSAFLSNYRGNITSLTPLETPLWIPHLAVFVGLTMFMLDMVCHTLRSLLAFAVPSYRAGDIDPAANESAPGAQSGF